MKDHMSESRGLSMEIRGIGKTDLFSTEGTSLATSRKVPAHTMHNPDVHILGYVGRVKKYCRYPFAWCRRLLPLFGVPVGEPLPIAYDADMNTADVDPY
jgi:hypothetical protein